MYLDSRKPLRGIFPVLQIPFDAKDAIIEKDLRSEVDYCIENGCHGLVVPALASEFLLLSDNERYFIVETVMRQAAGRVPVIVGVSAATRHSAVDFSLHAVENGASAVLALPPYIRKFNFQGIFDFFSTISENITVPLIIQNAPAPFGANLSTNSLCILINEIENVRYIKEERQPAGHFISEILEANPERLLGVFGGTAGLHLLSELSRGAIGCMPSAAMPEFLVDIYEEFILGNVDAARALYTNVLPLLNMEMSLLMGFSKAILLRHGVFTTTRLRDPEFTVLDHKDLAEMDAIFSLLDKKVDERMTGEDK